METVRSGSIGNLLSQFCPVERSLIRDENGGIHIEGGIQAIGGKPGVGRQSPRKGMGQVQGRQTVKKSCGDPGQRFRVHGLFSPNGVGSR